jgi:hypothetical protein
MLVSQFKGEGSVSQDGPTYFGNCAYYATNDNPQQTHLGVAVLDVSNTSHPLATKYLDDTPTMLNPHETLRAHVGSPLSIEQSKSGQSEDTRMGACVYLLHALLQRLEQQQPGLISDMTEGVLHDRAAMNPEASATEVCAGTRNITVASIF